jgi:hypothetical protein
LFLCLPPSTQAVFIASGHKHTCAITGEGDASGEAGRIVCWGARSHHQTSPPPPSLLVPTVTKGWTEEWGASAGVKQASGSGPGSVAVGSTGIASSAIPATAGAVGAARLASGEYYAANFKYSDVSAGAFHSCAIATPTDPPPPPPPPPAAAAAAAAATTAGGSEMWGGRQVVCWGGSVFEPRNGPDATADGEASPPRW